MKVLVTGGNGFLGSHTARLLAKQGCDVVVYDIAGPESLLPKNIRWVPGDVTDYPYLSESLKDCEEAYDFAGILGTSELNTYPIRTVEVNVLGAANFFEACRQSGVKRLYHVSKPTFTGHSWENMYSWSKTAAADLGLFYQQFYKMNVAITKYFNATGFEQHQTPVRKFVPLMILLAMDGYDLEIYGSGEQTLDIIDARDIAETTVLACRHEIISRTPHIYDNGSGTAVTCNQVAGDIIELTRSTSKIVHVPMRAGEKADTRIVSRDHVDLQKLLNYKLQYDYKTCLRDTVAWYLEKYRDRKIHDRDLDYFIKRDGLKLKR